MTWEQRKAAKNAVIALVIVLVVMAAAIYLVKWTLDHHCARRATLMGLQYKSEWGLGCMVRTQRGQWLPMENFRP